MRSAVWLLWLAGCGSQTGWVFQPFAGPGWSDQDGLLLEHEGPLVLATTYLARASGGEARRAFRDVMDGVSAELDSEPEGLVGTALGGRVLGREYRTVTVWTSEEAMYEFVTSEAHLRAMEQVGVISDPERTFQTGYWEIEADALPPVWDEVIAELEAQP
jgi:heme-degrading monooxygenase HmoA